MPFIGRTPTPVPLTSSDITDGIISTAKIANDAVDNTKLDLSDNFAFTGTITGAGGGKVLAIYQDTKTDSFTSNSSSLVDITGFEITGITPASTSRKFLITVSFGSFQSSGDNTRAFASLIKTVGGSDTNLLTGDAAQGHEHLFGNCDRSNDGNHTQNIVSYQYLDSPNTTSNVAYKFQVTKGSDAGYVTINSSYQATNERANTASAMQVVELSS